MKTITSAEIYKETQVTIDSNTKHWCIVLNTRNSQDNVTLANLIVDESYFLDYYVKTGIDISAWFNSSIRSWNIKMCGSMYTMRMINNKIYVAVGSYAFIPPIKKYVHYVIERFIKVQDNSRRICKK